MKRDKEMLQSKDKLYHLSFGGTIHHYSDMFFIAWILRKVPFLRKFVP